MALHRHRGIRVRAGMRAFGLFFIASVLLLCGPAAADGSRPVSADWPVSFFSGMSEGMGEMRVLFFRAKQARVQSSGQMRKDGTLVLRQHPLLGRDLLCLIAAQKLLLPCAQGQRRPPPR